MRQNFNNGTRAHRIAFILVALALPVEMFSQTYYFTAPVTLNTGTGQGNLEVAFSDPANPTPPSGGEFAGTSAGLTFGTVNGAISYNSVANTMRFFGSVSGSPLTGNLSFNDSQTISGSPVTANVSISYTIGNPGNGTIPFDTGTVAGSPPLWNLMVPIPVSGSYSLVTGGNSYNGNFAYDLDIPVHLRLFSADSTTLTFSQFTTGGNIAGISLAQVTADNGLQMNLATTDPSDGTTTFSWTIDGTTFPAVVPEPSILSLLACGSIGLALGRRRNGRR